MRPIGDNAALVRRRRLTRLRGIHTARIMLAALVAACGGGDGATPPAPPVPEPVSPTVALSVSTLDLRGVGSEATVSATITPSSAALVWRSADATVATVSGTGSTVTVRAVSGGSTRITVTATNGTKQSEASIPVVVTPLVTALSIAAPALSPFVGDGLTLVATVVRDPGASTGLDWRSSTPAVATVDSTGRVTTLSIGTTTISATSRTNPTATASVVLRVLGRARAVAISPTVDTALVGAVRTFAATVTADSGIVRTVRWRSASPAIATIDATGRATALAVGSTMITALLDADTTIRATATLTVRAPVVLGISLSVRSMSLVAGDTAQLTAVVTGEPGANTALTFASTAPTVATVSSSGLITAVGVGRADITATSVGTPGRVSSVTLNVSRPTFSLRWTETNDAASPNGTPVPAMTAVQRRPDGLTYGVTATGEIWQRSTSAVWSRQSTPVGTALRAITAPTNDSVWISGVAGVILRRQGATWIRETVPTTAEIQAIAATASGLAYAAESRILYARTAGVWQALTAPPGGPSNGWVINALTTRGDTAFVGVYDIFLAREGAIYRYINGQWLTPITPGGGANRLGPIVAVSATELLVGAEYVIPAAAARIFRWSNGAWTTEATVTTVGSVRPSVKAFVRCDDGSYMATTTEALALSRNNNAWTESATTRAIGQYGVVGDLICASATDYEYGRDQLRGRVNGGTLTFDQYVLNLSGLSVGGSSSAVAAGGVLGTAWDGVRWRPFLQPYSGSSSVVYAAFADGTATSRSFETVGAYAGGTWNWTRNTNVSNSFESSMWGLSNAALFVSITGLLSPAISRFLIVRNGVSSELLSPSATTQFVRAHGASNTAVMAVGRCVDVNPQSACVARYDGAQTTLERVGTQASGAILNDVLVLSATSAVAVGNAGTAFRFNGSAWTAIQAPTTEDFTAVTGVSATEVYAFTTSGALYGFDGTTWQLLQRFSRPVRSARTVGSTAIAVGDNGMVVYGRSLTAARARR